MEAESPLHLKLKMSPIDIQFARGDTNRDLVNDLYEGTPKSKPPKRAKQVSSPIVMKPI